ncbi:MAG TPA: GntR family transcriptional regulator, partial [Modicisalibacter sp.]|nr:GntR family transcriptional regulator [Modicisalibacter sp.]
DFRPVGIGVKIERTDSWRAIAEQVERDVVLCSMKGTFELNELQLSRCFDVSRTITHRILLHLQSLGVVEKVKYSSWSVVPLDNERVHSLYEARRQLEPYMLARATVNIPKQDIVRYIEKLDFAVSRYPDVEGSLLDEMESDLHYKVVGMGGNQEIMGMLRRTRPILLVSKHLLGSSVDMPEQDPFFGDHLRVFEKMREGQAEQAGRALAEHLASSESTVVNRLSEFRDKGHIDVPGYLRWSGK